MTCRQCRFFKQCLEDADSAGQMFDPEYDGEHGCAAKRFSPLTNADLIRSMTDEELNNFICTSGWRLGDEAECLEWLKAPTQTGPEPGKEIML